MKKITLTILLAVEILIIGSLGVVIAKRYVPEVPLRTTMYEVGLPTYVSVPEESKSQTLLFTGDIMLGRLVKKQIQKQQDPLYPFLLIASTTRAADLTIGNLEGPISDRGANQGSIYSFRFEPVGTVNALQFAGFDVLSLANNHMWDWGKLAAGDTMTHLTDASISYVGFGKNYDEANAPVIRLVGGSTNGEAPARVAFFSFTNLYPQSLEARGLPGEASAKSGISDFSAMQDAISSLKASGKADIIVVLLHWGVEYQAKSSPWQQKLAHELIDAGADIIVGTHPHVAQETEHYSPFVKGSTPEGGRDLESKSLTASGPLPLGKGEGYIAYSLGNFVFDQDFSIATMQGLMIEATIKDKKVVDFKEIPIKLTPTFQPYIPQAQNDILK